MKRAHQWSTTVTIDASRERVWSAGEDLTLIPRFVEAGGAAGGSSL